jgi:tetratricopeptide (TPR) repeat protein
MITWQKLRDCVYQEGKKEEIISFGRKYVQHFKDLGLMEMVREHLEGLVKQFPDEQSVRTELADARFALGDHKTATQELMEYGNALLKNSDYDTAEGVFTHILKFDHNNERAREICEQISTGRFEERKKFRRKMIDRALVVVCLLLGAFVIGREMFVQQKLFETTRTVFADSFLEERRYDEAIDRIRELEEKYPFSYMSVYEVPALIEVLEAKKQAPSREVDGRQHRHGRDRR